MALKCCDITAGMMRHSVQIQRSTLTPDGAGGYSTTWVTIATVRAAVKPMSGREVVHSQRLDAQMTHEIFMRYRANFTPKDRLLFRDRAMQVRAIVNVEEANRWLKVAADEGVAT